MLDVDQQPLSSLKTTIEVKSSVQPNHTIVIDHDDVDIARDIAVVDIDVDGHDEEDGLMDSASVEDQLALAAFAGDVM